MVAVEAQGVADAVVQRIADGAAPARVGGVDPDLQPAVLDVAVEVEIGDARLNQGEMALGVDLQHAVHPLQVDDDAAADIGAGAAIGVVLAGGDRVERDPVPVGCPDNGLDLLHRVRANGGRGDQLIGLVLGHRERVPIREQVVVRGEDPVLPDGGLEFPKGGCEVLRADAGRQYRHDPCPC